jgi:alpha-beta hydrolase superfamily lysophospholipase
MPRAGWDRNKPFKDIAWGLGSHGVVVIRFDKVTHAHAAELKDAGELTLTDEYLPQASAAVKVLQQHPGVDPARVFVLGHSLGGTVPSTGAARSRSRSTRSSITYSWPAAVLRLRTSTSPPSTWTRRSSPTSPSGW